MQFSFKHYMIKLLNMSMIFTIVKKTALTAVSFS